MRWLLAIVAAFAAAPLCASFDDLPRRYVRPSLFAQEGAAPAAHKEHAPGGNFSLSIWGAVLRLPSGDPALLSGGTGFGIDFAWFSSRHLALSVGLGVWSYDPEYETPDGYDYRYVAALEVEPGLRFYPVHWKSGSLYLEARLVYMLADGRTPVGTTHAVGGGVYFGTELGWPVFRFVIEGGFASRFTVSHRDKGWLAVHGASGSGTMIIDLLRFGLRIYV